MHTEPRTITRVLVRWPSKREMGFDPDAAFPIPATLEEGAPGTDRALSPTAVCRLSTETQPAPNRARVRVALPRARPRGPRDDAAASDRIVRPAALAMVLALCWAATAAAKDASLRLGVSSTFSTDQPNRPTTFTLGLRYGSGSGQPPAVRGVVVHAPTGTRFAFSRPGACTASDQALMSAPDSACPASSRVGHGQFTAYSGAGAPADPAQGTTEVSRTPTGLLEAARLDGAPVVLGTDRFAAEGEFLRASPPVLPGLGPGGLPRSATCC